MISKAFADWGRWTWHRRGLAGLGLVAAVALGALYWPRAETKGGAAARTATIARRDFVRTLRLHGVVEAVKFHSVVAPRLSGQAGTPMVLTRLIPAGTKVQPGDLLAELDRQTQTKNFLDREADYRDRLEQIRKKKAEQAAALVRDERELKDAENAVESAQLDVRRNEILSRIDAEKNRQKLEEARARLDQVRNTITLRQRALLSEVRILEIQCDRAQGAMRQAQRTADRMVIKAPLAGLVVLNTIFKSNGPGEVQEGDEVRPGVPFLQVIDPQAMQVRARANQVDAVHLERGQRVTLRLDAYPDLVFPGSVRQVATIALGGSFSDKVRTFAAIFAIEGTDARLLPDLSAAVDVELERLPGSLVAPRDALVEEAGHHFLFVKNGRGFDKRPVTLGAACDHEAVVSGVPEGAVVLRGASRASRES